MDTHPEARPQSVGEALTARIPTVPVDATVADVERLLTEHTRSFDSIDYVYVVDGSRVLRGVASVKEVFRQPPQAKVAEVAVRDVASVLADATLQQAAHLALARNIKLVPVVDRSGVLLGVVPSDAILHTLNHEVGRLLLSRAGVPHAVARYDDVLRIPILTSLWHRLPWLLLGLGGGLLAAGIIERFEEVLSRNLALAAFIPLVVYMADAVGTQMEAFIIRDLATHRQLRFGAYLTRQLAVVLLIGLAIGAAAYGLAGLWFGQPMVGLVLGLSLAVAVVSSVVTGLVVPYVISRFHVDPANASSPLATIAQDLLSVLVYLWVATLLL